MRFNVLLSDKMQYRQCSLPEISNTPRRSFSYINQSNIITASVSLTNVCCSNVSWIELHYHHQLINSTKAMEWEYFYHKSSAASGGWTVKRKIFNFLWSNIQPGELNPLNYRKTKMHCTWHQVWVIRVRILVSLASKQKLSEILALHVKSLQTADPHILKHTK